MHETSLRGRRLGQVPAKGSYWFPARQDLDTMMSKIDSQLVDKIVIYNGPYSALYGPGLGFYDVQLLRAPQYDVGSAISKPTRSRSCSTKPTASNGSAGRPSGAATKCGASAAATAIAAAATTKPATATELPSSYKSRQADLALGGWLTPDSRIDFQYLRLDQTDVEFPGQFFDINALVTDAF